MPMAPGDTEDGGGGGGGGQPRHGCSSPAGLARRSDDGLSRKKSVSFIAGADTSDDRGSSIEPDSEAARKRRLMEGRRPFGGAEFDESSSADETTAIFASRASAAAGRRDYNTTTTSTTASSDAPGAAATSTEGAAAREAEATGVKKAGVEGLWGSREQRQRRRRRASSGRQRGAAGEEEEEVHASPDGQDGDDKGEGWWKRLAEKYGSVELENKGSVARDHLALERTFLAWLRTSLSFASIGIAVTQIFRLNTTIAKGEPGIVRASDRLRSVGKPLGATFVGVGVVVLFVGFHRYFESQHYVIRGKFPASRGSVLLIAVVTALLIIASLTVVLVVGAGSFET